MYSSPSKIVLKWTFFPCSISQMGDLLIVCHHENTVILSYIRWAGSSCLTCIVTGSNHIWLLHSSCICQISHIFRPLSTITTSCMVSKTGLPHVNSVLFAKWVTLNKLQASWHLIMKQFSRNPTFKMWRYDGGNHWRANTVLFDVLTIIINVYHTIYSACQTRMNKPLFMRASWDSTVGSEKSFF